MTLTLGGIDSYDRSASIPLHDLEVYIPLAMSNVDYSKLVVRVVETASKTIDQSRVFAGSTVRGA